MQGLIEGGNKHIEQAGDPITRDLLLIAHTTRIAHYEVAAYGFASAVAEQVGLAAEVQVLAEILEEDEGFLRELAAIGLKQFGVPVGGDT